MNQTVSNNDIKIAPQRSSRSPSLSLQDCIEVARSARKFGRKINNIHLAGGGSIISGAFIKRKAALGYFGLIEGKGTNISITDLAEKILYPKLDKEAEEAVKISFLTPDVYKNFYSSIEKNTEISISVITNLLIRQYGIQPDSVKHFLSTFLRSGIHAKVIKYSNDNKESIIFLHEDSKEEPASEKKAKQPVENRDVIVYDDKQTVDIALERGYGKLIVPRELTAHDAKKLKVQIDILANIFTE